MEADYGKGGWGLRAACRWTAYLVLWCMTVTLCAVSKLHVVLVIVGAMSGCLLAASLPLLFATLFEAAYTRRARSDMLVVFCPWIGSAVIIIGACTLIHCSALLMSQLSHADLASVRDLCAHYAGVPLKHLPRSVCIDQAFVKTDWEAGKLECSEEVGRVACAAAFVAAPMFNTKALADVGKPDEIWAWAVTKGQHVDANYRFDGSFCGYLAGMPDLEFYVGDFRLAVERVIEKQQLALETSAVDGAPASPSYGVPRPGQEHGDQSPMEKVQEAELEAQEAEAEQKNLVSDPESVGLRAPLEGRPIVLSVDPLEVRYELQAYLVAATIMLCLCPCVGPIPLAFMFLYWCWAGSDRYSGRHAVATADYDDDDERKSFF